VISTGSVFLLPPSGPEALWAGGRNDEIIDFMDRH